MNRSAHPGFWFKGPCQGQPHQAQGFRVRGFTLVEMMIAITILSLILVAIYSTWTAILRSSKAGRDVAAAVQRARMAVRILEDSLSSTRSFVANQAYYAFLADNGQDATLSFVARLAPSFPRSGKFGDLSVRRLTFSVENARDGGRQLVLRQVPLMMEPDIDEKEHPIVLAKNVREFAMQFWDSKANDWTDEWKQTNQIPKLMIVTVKMAPNPNAPGAEEEISRIINIPATAVQPVWQMPRVLGQPGALPPGVQPGIVPPGTPPGGTPPTGQQPGFSQPGGVMPPR
jgi:general secretion pathway protein J